MRIGVNANIRIDRNTGDLNAASASFGSYNDPLAQWREQDELRHRRYAEQFRRNGYNRV